MKNSPRRAGPSRVGIQARLALVLTLLSVALPLDAQLLLPQDRGVVAAGLLLRQLDGEKRVLMIGAHPDDEDTSLLAALARGMGAQTAYLALTRGEGGQNLIGPELDEGLGIIRSGELIAARRLDGGRQFFTRAFDFGFSKTSDETFGYWPRDELLRDAVEIIRRFRPQIIISVFSGTPRDGHGHHQVAGMISTEAFSAAGDPGRFPGQISDGLLPWQPQKLYQRFRGLPGGETLPFPVGEYDPLLGRSHFQIAMDSRSQHRSQDMGAAQGLGPRESSVSLAALAPGVDEAEGGFFGGVDTTLVALVPEGFKDEPGGPAPYLERYRAEIARAVASLDALDPGRAAPPLRAALQQIRGAIRATGSDDPTALREALERREVGTIQALLAVSSVVVDVRTDRDVVVPGEDVGVELSLWNGGGFILENVEGALQLPDGWDAMEEIDAPADDATASFFPVPTGVSSGSSLLPGELRRWKWRVTVPEEAEPSALYYLENEREGEMYRWPEDRNLRGLPRDPAPLRGTAAFSLDGSGPIPSTRLSSRVDGRFVGVDKALGEFSRPLLILPALSVATDPSVLVWPDLDSAPRSVTVRVRSQSSESLTGSVALEVPAGWSVSPSSAAVVWAGPGAETTTTFAVRRVPNEGANPLSGSAEPEGLHIFRAVATTSSGRSFREGFSVIDYPHIERAPLFRSAQVRVPVFPVQVTAGLRVGYIEGSGDDGAEALRQMGAAVEVLSPERVAAGGLQDLDAVVLGVRVFEVVPTMAAANPALLDFARAGGTVVVQYNKYEYPQSGLAPYPIAMARPHDRVTDETSTVTLLDPESPVFTSPNRISGADFDGWVQERGLYFLSEWAEPFVPLLEMADPGEDPKQGSLMVAPLGDGLYIYTGLAFFRQFPEGVTGAYRLFANLVSLTGEAWRAHHRTGTQGGMQ